MKLSLAWLFDHIAGSFVDYDIDELVNKLSLTIAEIDGVVHIKTDVDKFTLARVAEITDDQITMACGQKETVITLPVRTDVIEGAVYLLHEHKDGWCWATRQDLHCTKEGLLPAVTCSQKEFEGAWRDAFVKEDYILDVDNSSITHRPDLWSHRGFARELAAILKLPMIPADQFYAQQAVDAHDLSASPTHGNPFGLIIEAPKECKRFAAFSLANVGYHASWLWMAQRLCAIDASPINGIVDAANYVMFDIGQPLHAFDADTITTKQLIPRMAKKGEQLLLLDGQAIELVKEDLVISDGVNAIALAGVMGGKATEVTNKTRSIIVEAATFDAASIRKSAQRHKLRTEASMRFEKSLDTHLNIKGLQRFIKLLENQQVPLAAASDIISLGKAAPPVSITIQRSSIDKMLGVTVSTDEIVRVLTALDFTVRVVGQGDACTYEIDVPSLRASKDIENEQDIVEEIGRFYGYGNITPEMPAFQVRPTDLTPVQRRRAVKYYIATNLRAREVKKYPVFDEQFLTQLAWQPERAVGIKNPLSQNWRRMITSLVPHLFSCIKDNEADAHKLRFFEWGRQWHLEETDKILERKMLAGIMYDQYKPIDFYTIKDQLTAMYNILGFEVTWEKATPELPWYHPYQTALLRYEHYGIGMMGVVHPAMLSKVAEGHAIVFELDGDFLLTAQPKPKKYVPVAPYQDSWRDVSLFVPLPVTVAQLEKIISDADPRIFRVEMVDYYQRKEWPDKRSITMRFFARDDAKTLEKEEIDVIFAAVAKKLDALGTTLR